MQTATKIETRQRQIDKLFDQVIEAWRSTSLAQPTDTEIELLRIGFAGNVKKRLNEHGNIAMLRNPPSWCGYVKHYGRSNLDSTIVVEKFEQCLANTTGKLLAWHRSTGNLGAIFNAQFQGTMLGKVRGTDDYFDRVETFCLMLLHLNGCESTAIKAWSKAYGV